MGESASSITLPHRSIDDAGDINGEMQDLIRRHSEKVLNKPLQTQNKRLICHFEAKRTARLSLDKLWVASDVWSAELSSMLSNVLPLRTQIQNRLVRQNTLGQNHLFGLPWTKGSLQGYQMQL